ncbi:MAG: MBL fold metallo-hydrolase [Akkermansiaceae bacterium]|nr:MBL fold metallo-hydrolase [Akkermansiaceae bacterium]
MIRFAVLGSGSGGNSAVVECGDQRLLIDAGLSAKQIELRLKLLGIEPSSLSGILLTHEHGDHVRGLKVFLKKHPLPVLATPQTALIVRETGIEHPQWKHFETGQRFELGDTQIHSFAIQHDAVDPVGFVISHRQRRLGLVSDAGFITHNMRECLRELHGLFIEANYDDGLLEADTKRPWSIKQRISSRHGHLSNKQVGELLREIAHPGLQQLILGHLSSDCNQPEVAMGHLKECLLDAGHSHIAMVCATQGEPTGWIQL